jgi:hypothetical protein
MLSSAFFVSLDEVRTPSTCRDSWGIRFPGRLAFVVAYQRLSDTLEPEARQGIEGAHNAAMVVLLACPCVGLATGQSFNVDGALSASIHMHEFMPWE